MEKKSVNLGLIAGGAIVVIMFVVDIIDNHMMVHFAMSFFPSLLIIAAMFLSAREAKKDYEYLSFTDAFKEAFIPFLVGNGIYMIFNYFLFNFIDQELGDIARERALEIFDTGVLDNLLSADQLEQMIEATRENNHIPTLIQTFREYLFSLILPGALVSLIFAAIYRTRSKPSFTEADSDEQ